MTRLQPIDRINEQSQREEHVLTTVGRNPFEDPIRKFVRAANQFPGKRTPPGRKGDIDASTVSTLVSGPPDQSVPNHSIDRARHRTRVQTETIREIAYRKPPFRQQCLEGHTTREADSKAALLVSLKRIHPLVGEPECFPEFPLEIRRRHSMYNTSIVAYINWPRRQDLPPTPPLRSEMPENRDETGRRPVAREAPM